MLTQLLTMTTTHKFPFQWQKAEEETNLWRLKYERDGVARIEELENAKMKLQARLAECEGTVDNLNTKLVMLEKSKAQLQGRKLMRCSHCQELGHNKQASFCLAAGE